MSSNSKKKKTDEYIFSAYDQLLNDTSLDDYVFTAEDHPDFRSSTQYIPDKESDGLPRLRPKNYLILVCDDKNDSFMVPAR